MAGPVPAVRGASASIVPQVALTLQSGWPRIAGLAAGHVLVAGGVAWYVVDAVWGSIPVSASLTPVPGVAWVSAWISGTIFLFLAAPLVGAASVRGPWVGADPTTALPPGIVSRTVQAWVASLLTLLVIAIAPLPVYLSLGALGAWPVEASPGYVMVQAAVVLAAPLPGIALALHRGRRR